MILQFQHEIPCGEGHSAECIHTNNNKLQVVYRDEDGNFQMRESIPILGKYNNLTWEERGNYASGYNVSNPRLKKFPHYGMFGFIIANGRNTFITTALAPTLLYMPQPGNETNHISTKYPTIVTPAV